MDLIQAGGSSPPPPMAACGLSTKRHIAAMEHVTASINLAELAHTSPELIGDIRSDHAGETGAVMIYRGILAGTADPVLRAFAQTHMATEQNHLDLLDGLLRPDQRSILLPLWRVAGWLTGFLPTLAGSPAVYATIDAVETFVDHHYEAQIQKCAPTGMAGALRTILLACQADEVHHRDEARMMQAAPMSILTKVWAWLVGAGSKAAVAAARRI
jgi:ubiquinone biosynthesis monooxygenase Coq7